MTIIVRRSSGQAFEVVTGLRRLKAALKTFGKATVTEASPGGVN